MHKNVLKLIAITVCTLSSISAIAAPGDMGFSGGGNNNIGVLNDEGYIAFMDMPRATRKGKLSYQCMTPRDGYAARAPAALMSAWCDESLTFRIAGSTAAAVISRSGLCMDIAGGDVRAGGIVNLWTCSGSENQKWVMTNVGSTAAITLRPKTNTNLCVDIQSGSTAPIGSNMLLWHCSEGVNQKITIRSTPQDAFEGAY